jgi:hypothetical protein
MPVLFGAVVASATYFLFALVKEKLLLFPWFLFPGKVNQERGSEFSPHYHADL